MSEEIMKVSLLFSTLLVPPVIIIVLFKKKFIFSCFNFNFSLLQGNEIIKKLQDELRGYISKIKLKNEVTTRQESVLKDKEQAYERTKRDLDEKTKQLQVSNAKKNFF